jgi:MerR family copper efflux transcriptional regulator
MQFHVDMKSTADADLTIGELGARFGLATHVLRHWESRGLLTPRRLANGRRRYGPADLVQVALIRRGKEAGFSLEDIREVVRAADGHQRRALLRRHRDELQRQIDRLTGGTEMIDHALECTAPDMWQCPVFRTQLAALVPADPRQR